MDLTWDKIDFERNTIDFLIEDNGGDLVDRKPRAITPMAPPLRSFLLARYQEYAEVPVYVLHQKKNPKRRVLSIVKGFKKAAARCGFTDVTPHTFRHTCVSSLRSKGVMAHVVKDFLAMSEETQNKIYNHTESHLVFEAAELLV